MPEININFINLKHYCKLNLSQTESKYSALHSNTQYSEFSAKWPWKNPLGENQSERERVYYFFRIKIRHQIYSKKSNLCQPRNLTNRLSQFPCFCCLDFYANSLEKRARNINKIHPSKTMPTTS